MTAEATATPPTVKMDKDREGFLAMSASDLAEAFESLLSPVDAAVLGGRMAEFLTYYFHEGLTPGSQGWWDESCAYIRPWGSGWLKSLFPCCCCTAGRKSSFPSGMANG
jgi:hypothetical protein